jgi:hypothetical protein
MLCITKRTKKCIKNYLLPDLDEDDDDIIVEDG